MEIITQHHAGESAELKLRGRLDGYWADHLAAELDRRVRDGAHRLWLDVSEVSYLSSPAIGVLMRVYKQLTALGGSFKLVNPSEPVKEVLEVSRLAPLLIGEPPGHRAQQETSWLQRAPQRGTIRETDSVTLETFDYPSDGPLRCWTVGDPSLLLGCRFGREDCLPPALGADAYAVGIGALGRDFDDCRGRFGEFLAAAGVAAYLPTDGTNVPDYRMVGDTSTPNLRLCYGLVFEGTFSSLIRFETEKEAGPATLTALVEAALDVTNAESAGIVLVAESAGLMGAALRRSPAEDAPPEAPFAYPGIRDWLTFTGERAYRSSTTLVVGVATRGEPGRLAPLLRPLGRAPRPVGHFHAAPFSHRTLSMGELDLKATVDALFEAQHLQGVLHLLGDYRELAGLGESEFVRGACWAAPLGPVEPERRRP